MKSLRILMLEDNPADAELVLAKLAEEGIGCDPFRVDTRADFLQAVQSQKFDLVLSDCSLPSFDGFSALEIAREQMPETPFIFVSGTMGEEIAIETLKRGATDYVLKHRLARLGPAVRRAMAEAEARVAQRLAEKSRSEAESLFRVLFDQATIGVAILGLDGRIVKINQALKNMLGHSDSALTNTPIAELIHPDDAAEEVEALAGLSAGQRASYEMEKRFVRQDGSTLLGHVVVSLIRNEVGEPRFVVKIIQDITERKELERRFLQAQKMEVVGRLAAGVAHDFNNLLTVINGYSQMLLSGSEAEGAQHREIREIRDAGERAAALTQRLLGFSRQNKVNVKVLDVNAILTGLEHMLRRVVGDDIKVVVRTDPQGAWVQADQTQIEQMILNLAINARDAMRNGGQLTISTKHRSLSAPPAQQQGLSSGDHVLLTVNDTGHGMDEATKSRIFEPFFTTKDLGKGTGLGLWMARETILSCHGTILVDSERGRGTSFHIYLPAAASETSDLEALAGSVGRASIGGAIEEQITIVVADDDPSIRTLLRDQLGKLGYRVIEAKDGKQAIATLRTSPADLLITDLLMPNQEGIETIQMARNEFPKLPILAMSGSSQPQYLVVAEKLGAAEVIAKPFAMEKVQAAVERLTHPSLREPIERNA